MRLVTEAVRRLAAVLLAGGLAGTAHAGAADCPPAPADDPAGLFARGRCEADAGRPAQAVLVYQALLASADSPRVRLELARALAATGRRDEALAAYAQVLAAHPPEPVDGWVRSEMAALTAAPVAATGSWTWTRRAGLGALADSNVNAGPADANIEVFGLPFVLTGDSLAQRDVGGTAWLGANGSRDGDWGRWHVEAQWTGTRYRRHGDFSLDALSVQGGLALAGPGRSADIALALDAQHQRDGHGRDSATLAAQGLQELSPGLAVAWLGGAGRVRTLRVAGADGRFALAGASLAARGGAGLPLPEGVEALAGVRMLREALGDADRSHVDLSPQLALQSAALVCEGCSLTLDLTRTLARYDGTDPAFALARRDRLLVVSLRLAHGGAGEGGASWQCAVERASNASTIPVYTYVRTLLRCTREWSWG